tara:strand:- start:1103 stop:1753 length:651 start_codon:yes stop_codon:yes gene_type:complete
MNKFNEGEKKEKTEKSNEELATLMSYMDKQDLRFTGIYGDITEERCSEAIYGLLALHEMGKELVAMDPDEPEKSLVETYKPIDFYISTFGGVAAEMFSVYDTIRSIRDKTPIYTHGLGKVMSAGVPLLASGTKGHRYIGKNCRVMIHGVISGQHGHLANIANEFEEAKMTQKLYVRALAEETNMDEKYVRRLMNKKTNVYLDAEEAVKLGIADIIF